MSTRESMPGLPETAAGATFLSEDGAARLPAAIQGGQLDDWLPALVSLRRDLHAHPELGFQERRTAGIVAQSLRLLGLEVHEGVGGTGVVGTLRVGHSGRSIGLRADMDALPMAEQASRSWRSLHPQAHHGCGHDGHTAMLLGAAQVLAREREKAFDGTVHFFFQPAEEGQGGARVMVEEGLFQRFPCDAVYALHNWPELPLGQARTRPGPIMAAADRFDILLSGKGGHAAQPHRSPDVLLAASALVMQLNTLVARRIDPVQSAVLSVTQMHGGSSHNVLPAQASITGTVRTFDPESQDRIEEGLREAVAGVAAMHGLTHEVRYHRYYPATINTDAEAALALRAAADVGLQAEMAPHPAFTSEDFAFMLRERPGAYLWLGQGRRGQGDVAAEDDRPLHHPCYDFNDAALPLGVRWFCAVARRALPPGTGPRG